MEEEPYNEVAERVGLHSATQQGNLIANQNRQLEYQMEDAEKNLAEAQLDVEETLVKINHLLRQETLKLDKDKNILELSKKLNMPLEKIAAVGNSCFDIPMLEVSGIGIAFNSDDDCIREKADYVVEGRDLSRLIPIFEQHI